MDLHVLTRAFPTRRSSDLQIDRLRPDVLLLDIQMAGLGGVELAEHLLQTGGHCPQIIFVTAFNQHAVRAFEARAVDYRSEEHTSELQSLMRTSYAVFCLKTKTVNSTTKDKHEGTTN